MSNKQCSDSAQKGPGLAKGSGGKSPSFQKPASIGAAKVVPSHSRGKDGKTK
jgi:hypothetical protein